MADDTGDLIEAVMGPAKTDVQLRREMTDRIADLEKQLAERKGEMSEIDAALAEKETVWWQAHPDFPPRALHHQPQKERGEA